MGLGNYHKLVSLTVPADGAPHVITHDLLRIPDKVEFEMETGDATLTVNPALITATTISVINPGALPWVGTALFHFYHSIPK